MADSFWHRSQRTKPGDKAKAIREIASALKANRRRLDASMKAWRSGKKGVVESGFMANWWACEMGLTKAYAILDDTMLAYLKSHYRSIDTERMKSEEMLQVLRGVFEDLPGIHRARLLRNRIVHNFATPMPEGHSGLNTFLELLAVLERAVRSIDIGEQEDKESP